MLPRKKLSSTVPNCIQCGLNIINYMKLRREMLINTLSVALSGINLTTTNPNWLTFVNLILISNNETRMHNITLLNTNILYTYLLIIL